MRLVSLRVGPILIDFKPKTRDVLNSSLLYKMQTDIIFAKIGYNVGINLIYFLCRTRL